MDIITKKICLEDFKSRYNGFLPSYKNNIVTTYDSDYNRYPVDTIIPRSIGDSTEPFELLLEKLYPLRDNLCCAKRNAKYAKKEGGEWVNLNSDYLLDKYLEDGTIEGYGGHFKKYFDKLPEEYKDEMEEKKYYTFENEKYYILRYKTMVKLFHYLDNFIQGRNYDPSTQEVKDNCNYYMLCKRKRNIFCKHKEEILADYDGVMEWVSMTDRMWEQVFETAKTVEKDNFSSNNEGTFEIGNSGLTLPYKKFFLRDYEACDIEHKCVKLYSDLPLIYYYDEENETEAPYYDEDVDLGQIICVNSDAKNFMKIFYSDDDFIYQDYSGLSGNEEIITKMIKPDVENCGKVYQNGDDNYIITPNHCDRIPYEYIFYKCAKYMYEKGRFNSNEENPDDTNFREKYDSKPYASIPIYIEQELDDIGVLDAYIEEWEGNKPYYYGENVYFNGNIYTLTIVDAEGNFIPDNLLSSDTLDESWLMDEVLINKDEYALLNKTYGENINWRFECINSNVGIYIFKRPYYCGYYDEDERLTYFDEDNEPDENGNFTHWKRSVVSSEDDSEENVINGILESKVLTLQRTKKSVDDNGVELPFFINLTVEGKTTNTNELTFLLGNCNILKVDGVMCCDHIENITFDYGKGKKSYTYSREKKSTSIEQGISGISTNEITTAMSAGTVSFEYWIGCKLNNNDGTIQDNSYIKYFETYNYALEKYHFVDTSLDNTTYTLVEVDEDDYDSDSVEIIEKTTISDMTKNKASVGHYYRYIGDDDGDYTTGSVWRCMNEETYIRIYFDNPIETINNADLDAINSGNVAKSNISFSSKQTETDEFYDIFTYKDDALLGVQDITRDIDIQIERGTSDAIERHHILSEVNTFEDLENYRNNIFFRQNKVFIS